MPDGLYIPLLVALFNHLGLKFVYCLLFYIADLEWLYYGHHLVIAYSIWQQENLSSIVKRQP